jgi:competence protein ComEA
MNVRKPMLHLAAMAALAATLLATPAVTIAQQATRPASHKAMMVNPVDINSATEAELRAVPGIGSVYAKRIVASRPYTSKDQLVTKGVLPQGVYDKVKGYLVAHRVPKTKR